MFGKVFKQACHEVSKVIEGQCCICEASTDIIVGIFVSGKESKQICRKCWKHLARLAKRTWLASHAVIDVSIKEPDGWEDLP